MRKIAVLLFVHFFISVISFGQKHISVEQLDQHLGETVTICDKINAIQLPDDIKNYSTIKVGKSNLKSSVFVQISNEVLNKLTNNGKTAIDNKTICVTGRVMLKNGIPQIVVNNSNSIHLTNNDNWIEIRPNAFWRFD